ncbi:cell division protein ZapE [Hoyosella rhizosphaerae]|uniref:Cell division protein ZapE n=1 Tax=Hoyosella rhizosphaerae TaxID=1755582 RepID=A0A916U1V0_9ACTN|nr:cell division protein ZapE [Hoyosella rhizosphaerae]MBN4926650.1 cell division protein ZapE [Hoyosella rhizosphaerae]GGC57567.1 cell division protein ZapE [Hoyosella rhizosphaerae]
MFRPLHRGVSRSRPNQLAVLTGPRFRHAAEASALTFDPAQTAAIAALAGPVAYGHYLFGDVGRGKTMLSELYYDTVPTTHKRRFHFHSYFRDLQSEVVATRQPVEKSITRIIGNARAVLFDEFHVHDVADAVYLTKTLQSLIERNILVLTTSNYAPADLMPNPLYHDRFLPAINMIESRLDVVSLAQGPDYRQMIVDPTRLSGFSAGRWTLDPTRVPGGLRSPVELTVNALPVRAVAAKDEVVTFTFAELCERPLGVREYLRIAENYSAICVLAVPDLAEADRDPLLRFSNMVDVFYDRNQRIDIQAIAVPARMLQAKEPPYDAARTLSRLSTLSTTG